MHQERLQTEQTGKEWKFFSYQEGEKRRDSSSEKHFKGLEIEQSLIRELIQNSLDARDDKSKPVEIKIYKKNEVDCKQYFNELAKHYDACGYDENFPTSAKTEFLILEDFNTVGLKEENQNDFFQKDNIKSDGSNRSGGSHGIGKAIFYVASEIKTFFAYSIFGKGKVFRGTADFKTHTIDEEDFKEDGSLELDVEQDHDFIAELFSRRQQKGLSIAIPLPKIESLEKLGEAIIDEYYYPIISRALVVHLNGEKIDSDYILDKDKPKTTLISEYITYPNDFIEIDVGYNYSKVGIKIDGYLTPQQKEEIISCFSEEGKGYSFIKFRFKINVKNGETKDGFLYFLIQKKEDEEKEERFDFWREYILVKEARSRSNSSKKYTVILLINGENENNELSILLRELENPSHMKWEYQNLDSDVKNKYKHIRQLVPFITQLPNEIISVLKTQGITLDSNFFSDFFPAIGLGGSQSSAGPRAQDPGKSKIKPIISNPNFIFKKNRAKNGFTLSLSEDGKKKSISKVRITAAYGTNKGNPFKNYDEKDFDFSSEGGISIQLKKSENKILEKAKNQIFCQIKDESFEISFYGFDHERELRIDISETEQLYLQKGREFYKKISLSR